MSAPTVPRKISALLENMFTQQEVIKTKVGEIWRASGVSQSRISLLPHSAGTDGVGNGVVVDVTRGVTFQGAGDGRGHRRHYGSSRCVRPFRSIQTGRTSAATDRSWGWWALMRAGNSIWATAQLDLQMLRRTSRIASGRSSIIHFGQLDKTQLPDSEEEKDSRSCISDAFGFPIILHINQGMWTRVLPRCSALCDVIPVGYEPSAASGMSKHPLGRPPLEQVVGKNSAELD